MSTSTKERLEPALVRAAIVVVLGTIMAILDTTIVAVALHQLSIDFRTTVSTIQWVTTGYLLSLAIVIPLSGWAIHRLGAKRVYMISLALFVGGSILCALAWSATSLIGFRVLQGFGGGMIMPVGQAIMARTAGPQRMGKVMGIVGVPQLLGPILGPVIGGLIVSNISWRWIFLVNVPIGLVALWLSRSYLAPTPGDNQHRFDFVGFALLAPGLALIVYGLSEVGVVGGFHGPSVWFGIVGGLILSAGFVARSMKAREPLIDLQLFRDRSFSVATIGIFLTGATLYGTMFLLPLYYQIDRGDAAWKAGLMMAPQGIGAAMVMRLAGSLADKHGPRYVASFGMAGLALGTFFYTFVGSNTSYYFLGLALFVRGIGLGFGMMPVVAASYRNLTHAQVPKATSATNIFRQIGGSLGVAVFAVVLDTQIAQRVGTSAAAAIQNGVARATPTQLQQIAHAFGHSFWWSFGTCVLGIVPALFLPRTSIAKQRDALTESLVLE
ncbi:MAG: MDR family MFS transporter [Actinomycetota bacterium]|jgi:EmrB/QacA subfamily drug resistance transporter|nr:MDR family MFS transporter [Actinomycetota bacterium]